MKKITLILIILGASLLSGCERKLPYDLDGITRGVAIDLSKTPFSTYLLSENSTDGNYSVDLTIPNLQGDFSFMREVRVMCHFVPYSNPSAVQYVEAAGPVAGSEFEHETPVSVPIDMPALCSRLGITAPALSDVMTFTTDVTLNSGDILPGWTELTGYTNTTSTNWKMADGSSFQNSTSYGAYSSFEPSEFQGSNVQVFTEGDEGTADVTIIDEKPDASLIPYGFTAEDYHGRHIIIHDGAFLVDLDITLWINEADYTLLIPDQRINDDLDYDLGYLGLNFAGARGNMDTTNLTLTIISNVTHGPYGWSGVTFILTF